MVELLGLWSHALAAALYGALAAWQLRHRSGEGANKALFAAFAIMSVWAVFQAAVGPLATGSALAESARNLAFLTFMYGTIRDAADDDRQRAVKTVYGAVASVIGLQIVLAFLAPQFRDDPTVFAAMTSTGHGLGLTVAAGSLVLLHNLYGQASSASRAALQMPVIALAALWAYDLHLYTYAYLTGEPFNALFALRGAVAAMLVPLFALASRRGADWRVQMSRSATFQSLSLLAILGYFIVMMSATKAMKAVGGEWMMIAQVALVFGMTAAALALLPSGKARAWLKVVVSKHFFEHRYDYREDWLRFTRAVGSAGHDDAPLGERVVKALADMAGSPGGLLLLADEQNRLAPAARWNWSGGVEPSGEASADLVRFLEASCYVIDFGALQGGCIVRRDDKARVPAWLSHGGHAWAGIPLVHNDRLVGLLILDHPVPRRPMDWEDYDLFRTAGIQAASYIAEARSQEALADARRFDEFNRRFAFIMHDIKNLVSQLSLVARNAERHADNPEFRADMTATLQSSVQKMNDLLARLSRGSAGEAQPPRPVPVQPIVARIAEAKKRLHVIEVEGDARIHAVADPARLEQALGHLVQNAIDASPADVPVRVRFAESGREAVVEVIDGGEGMSAEFIRTRLFQPFASTKESGFGVGAFEARTLVAAMGGRIEVASREGEGSRFTIFLPIGAAGAAPLDRRMRA